MSSKSPTIKFRPSLSADQISHIINLLESSPHSTISSDCLKALRVFKLKADHGIITPSHISTGRPTLVDSLGFTAPVDIAIETLLKIYKATPQVLSKDQLSKVQMHRYLNDLMSPEEETEYEGWNSNSQL